MKGSATVPIIGNRGPHDPATGPGTPCADCPVYEESITLEFHGGSKQWVGNIGFNDNHVDLVQTLYPEGMNYLDNGETFPDHLFLNDAEDCNSGLGNDVWLTLISEITSVDGQLISECD